VTDPTLLLLEVLERLRPAVEWTRKAEASGDQNEIRDSRMFLAGSALGIYVFLGKEIEKEPGA
jgi:hypothetical protein